jgi:hypothetical protein
MYGVWGSRWKISGALFYALLVAFVLTASAAITQIDLTSQVKGLLPIGNGGTGQGSFSAGLLRSSGSALSSAELSGDATTSGSNVITVAKVNGTSVPTNSAADQVVVTTASATGAWTSVPNCPSGALQYNTTTHAFACGSVLTGTVVDLETPSGTINGTNDTFTLAHAPSPAGSLHLYKNGQLMLPGGADYTLTGNSIVYVAGAIPKSGDVHRASYRY